MQQATMQHTSLSFASCVPCTPRTFVTFVLFLFLIQKRLGNPPAELYKKNNGTYINVECIHTACILCFLLQKVFKIHLNIDYNVLVIF